MIVGLPGDIDFFLPNDPLGCEGGEAAAAAPQEDKERGHEQGAPLPNPGFCAATRGQ
jgi:hypothetical protein